MRARSPGSTTSSSRAWTDRSKAYTHYLSCLPQALDYEWTLIVDLDEFVVLDMNQHASLASLLRARRAEGANAVALSWMMFTPSGKRRWAPEPLIARFDRREPHDNAHIKSAVITRDAQSSLPHDPCFTPGVAVRFVGVTGERHWWPGSEAPASRRDAPL